MVRNFTPHAIVILDNDANIIATYPSEGVARVNTIETENNSVDGVPVKKVGYSTVTGLPEPSDDYIVVSMVVYQALQSQGYDTSRILCPNTSPTSVKRDAAGQIIGVTSFCQY